MDKDAEEISNICEIANDLINCLEMLSPGINMFFIDYVIDNIINNGWCDDEHAIANYILK